MKNTILRATCILASLIVPAFSAHAETLAARIPFDFVVGTKTMSAGEYTFSTDTSGILVVRAAAPSVSSALAVVQADSAPSPYSASVAFDKATNAAVLSRITLLSGSAYLVPAPFRAKPLSITDSGVLLSRH